MLRKMKDRNRTYYCNDWISIYPGFRKLNFTVAPAGYFDNRWYIHGNLSILVMLLLTPFILYQQMYWLLLGYLVPYGQMYLHLPIRSKYDECDPPGYGFYFYSNGGWIPTSLVIQKGEDTKHYYMPWDLDWVRTSVLKKDGKWVHEFRGSKSMDLWREEWNGVFWSESHPYTYKLKSGEVQNVIATITVKEHEWRPRWFRWTPLFKRVVRSIEVRFSAEVGERAGSWKGGVIGCSYTLKDWETPEQCLRRMEKERTFY